MIVVTYDEFGGQWDHVPPPGQEHHRQRDLARPRDGQRCRLGGEGDAKAFRQPTRDAAVADGADPIGERRGPGDEPGGGE